MAKKLKKAVIGIGALAVAGKVGYNKYKTIKEKFAKEENDSADLEVKKYTAFFTKKTVEIEDEEFNGCDVKSVASNMVLDLGLARFDKDVYINFESTAGCLKIILPEGVNVTCDIEKAASNVKNLVDNVEEEDIHTVYIIGKSVCSSIEVIPVNFYVDDENDYEDTAVDECENNAENTANAEENKIDIDIVDGDETDKKNADEDAVSEV